jgi:hypothetical protein
MKLKLGEFGIRALANFCDPNVCAIRALPQTKKFGQKKKWNHDEVREAVKELPLHHKKTLRDFERSCCSSRNAIDIVVYHLATSALKPALTEVHKVGCVLYSVSKLDPVDLHYKNFYNSVHVDEKWFFLSEKELRLSIATDKTVAHQNCQNKDHLMKVMFLTAGARPRFNEDGICSFDGKIGMTPFFIISLHNKQVGIVFKVLLLRLHSVSQRTSKENSW